MDPISSQVQYNTILKTISKVPTRVQLITTNNNTEFPNPPIRLSNSNLLKLKVKHKGRGTGRVHGIIETEREVP